MLDYTYLTPKEVMERYPVIYNDAPDIADKDKKYLVLHEVWSRYQNNWNCDWKQYRGLVTWNPCVYEKHKDEYNIIYCNQYPNIFTARCETYIPFIKRKKDMCVFYGPPASIDTPIMMARYEIPLHWHHAGMKVDAYGVIPAVQRPEYTPEWGRHVFRGGVPAKQKHLTMQNYRFSLAFENSRDPYWACGWVTEKIYDCLGCGTIPIYWGAPDVTDRVPPEVFIDYRNFTGYDDLLAYIRKTPDEIFDKLSRAGLEFFDTVDFDYYLTVLETLS